MKSTLGLIVIAFSSVFISACGGGSGGGEGSTDATSGTPNPVTTPVISTPMPSPIVSLEPPVFTSSALVEVSENTELTGYKATVASDDNNIVFSIAGGVDQNQFSIDENTGTLVFNAPPNFESPKDENADNRYEINIQASSQGVSAVLPLTVTVLDIEEAPIFSSQDRVVVAENTLVTGYTFVASDEDGGAITYRIIGGEDSAIFQFAENDVLSFNSAPDFENPADLDADNEYIIQAEAEDSSGAKATLTLTVVVSDVNEAPAFVSSDNVEVIENTLNTQHLLEATDEDGDALSYRIVDGQDMDRFVLAANNTLQFIVAPNFEQPSDEDANNTYFLTVEVVDAKGGVATQDLQVTITDINEAPRFVSGDTARLVENGLGVVYTASVEDDEGHEVSFRLSEAEDAGLFEIDSDSGELSFKNSPDYETAIDSDQDNVYVVEVVAGDSEGEATTQVVNVEVIDENSLSLEITFPTPYSDLIGSTAQINVSGLLTDEEDELVEADDIGSITVNGIEAQVTPGPVAYWSALVPVTADVLDIEVVVESNTGDIVDAVSSVSNKPIIHNEQESIFDSARNRVLFFSEDVKAIVAVELDSGNRTVLSGAGVGSGPALIEGGEIVSSIALDSERNRLLAISSDNYCCDSVDSIFAIDLDSGNRTLLDEGSFYNHETNLVVADENKVFVVNPQYRAYIDGEWVDVSGSVSVIDFETGIESLISGDSRGEGRPLSYATSAKFDELENRLIITGGNVVEVDVETGNRRILSGDGVGTGVELEVARGVQLDLENGRAFVFDVQKKRLLSISLTSGDREVVSGGEFESEQVGSGPVFGYSIIFDIDLEGSRAIVQNGWQYIDVDLDTGNREIAFEHQIGIGEKFRPGVDLDLDYDSDSHSLLVADWVSGALVRVDLNSGDREVLSSSNLEGDFSPSNVVGSVSGTAFVTDSRKNNIESVDLETGARDEVSGIEKGAGDFFSSPSCLAVDAELTQAFICDNSEVAEIFQIDIESGNRNIIVSYDEDNSLRDIVPDLENNRLIVAGRTLHEVNIETGEKTDLFDGNTFGVSNFYVDFPDNKVFASRINSFIEADLSDRSIKVIADLNTGYGPMTAGITSIWVEKDKNRAYISSSVYGAILVVDLISGDRAIFSM